MPRTRPAYPPEFRDQIVALHRAGRSVAELAREFEPTQQTIRSWIESDAPSPRAAASEVERDELKRLRKEVKRLQQERDISTHHRWVGQKPRPGLLGRPAQCPQGLRVRESASGPVPRRAPVRGPPCLRPARGRGESGYYAWLERPPSDRDREDDEITEAIREAHVNSYGTYGAPRIHAELRAQGICVGKKRVARLMQAAGIVGVSRRRGPTTTIRRQSARQGPDFVARDFSAEEPDALWVADITYVPTGSGFLYLAVVLDAFSRRVIGWAMAGHLRSELVLAALDMAVGQRDASGVVHHSDHGCQPGFNRSSQHPCGGACDEHEEAEFRQGGASPHAFAWAPAGHA